MKIRQSTCGLCKPSKSMKRRNRRLEATLRRELLADIPARAVKLREHHR